MRASPREVEDLVLYQIGALAAIAAAEGVPLAHVKAHGALYNMAARDRALADAIARAVARVRSGARALRPAGLRAARRRATAPGFASRPRASPIAPTSRTDRWRRGPRPGSVIHDPDEVVRALGAHGDRRTRSPATDGSTLPLRVDTLCVHGDTPGAAELTRLLRAGLEQRGVAVRALSPRAARMTAPSARPSAATVARLLRLVARRHAGRAARAHRRGARLDARRVRRDALRAAARVDHRRPRDRRRQTAGAHRLGDAARRRRRRHRLRRRRRSLRPHARADGERAHLLGLHRRVRVRADGGAARRVPRSCSASAWAASGRAARRSCPRPGRREHRGKALGFMQSAWAIGYGAGGRSSTWSCCRGGAGAPCSSSACCRRSSRSGCGAT